MGEIIVHVGLDAAAWTVTQSWLVQQALVLAERHDLVVCRLRRVERTGGVVPGLPGHAQYTVRVAPVPDGSADSTLLWRQTALRRDAEDDAGLVGLHRRFVVETREAVRTHGRILLTARGFHRLLLERDPHFADALGELAVNHRVRLVGHVRPQHEALEAAWRSEGCVTGSSPSAFLAGRADELDHATLVRWVTSTIPDVDVELRPAGRRDLAGRTVPADFVRHLLGVDDLPVPEGAWDPMLPLATANLLASRPVPLDRENRRAVHDEAHRRQGSGPDPGEWPEDDPYRASRVRLLAWCRRRFDESNVRLARLLAWADEPLIGPGPDGGGVDPVEHDLEWIDEAWAPRGSAGAGRRRVERWRDSVEPRPLTAERCRTVRLLDLGCGSGDSLTAGPERFGVDDVLGVEVTVGRAREAQSRGLEVYARDLLDLDPEWFPAVDYVVLDNVLEHLPDSDAAARAVALACRIARRAVHVRHPSFESVDRLAEQGCKLHWTDWPNDHCTPLSLEEIGRMAEDAGAREVHRVDVGEIHDPSDERVLPLGAPPDQYRRPGTQGPYHPVLHGPKPTTPFAEPVHQAHDLFLRTGAGRLEVSYGEDPARSGRRPAVRWKGDEGPTTVFVDGQRREDEPMSIDDRSAGAATSPSPWPAEEGRLHPSEARLVDLGSGRGDSLQFAQSRFGCPGVGVESDADRVEKARERGLDVYPGDIRELDPAWFPEVDYVYLDNVLEHLADGLEVDRVLGLATEMARRAVVIRHPSFEDVDYLASCGLKLFWTDWPGSHTAPIRLHEFVAMATKHGVYRVDIRPEGRILDSSDARVLPVTALSDQTRTDPSSSDVYDAERHGPKLEVDFERPVYALFELHLLTSEGGLVSDPDVTESLVHVQPPNSAPRAWFDELAEAGAVDPLVVQSDDQVWVLEAGRRRPVPSGLVARALTRRFGEQPAPTDLSELVLGPPVQPLKIPGRTAFVIVGGRRLEIPRVPVPRSVDPELVREFPEGPPLDALRAAAEWDAERRARRRARQDASAAGESTEGASGSSS